MKKILFTTTALVATAGMAAAEVSFGGYGRFGLRYDESANEQTFVESRFRLNIDGSATTDGGVRFSTRVRVQSDDNGDDTTDNAAFNAPRFSAEYEGLRIDVGNAGGAIDNIPSYYGFEPGLSTFVGQYSGVNYSFTGYSSQSGCQVTDAVNVVTGLSLDGSGAGKGPKVLTGLSVDDSGDGTGPEVVTGLSLPGRGESEAVVSDVVDDDGEVTGQRVETSVSEPGIVELVETVNTSVATEERSRLLERQLLRTQRAAVDEDGPDGADITQRPDDFDPESDTDTSEQAGIDAAQERLDAANTAADAADAAAKEAVGELVETGTVETETGTVETETETVETETETVGPNCKNPTQNQTVYARYAFDSFAVAASYTDNADERWDVHFAYADDNWGVSLGYGENTHDHSIWVLVATADVGGFDITAMVGDEDLNRPANGADDDGTFYGFSVAYDLGAATTVGVSYGDGSGDDDKQQYGIGFKHDLGGGASIRGGIGQSDKGDDNTTLADLGVIFNF